MDEKKIDLSIVTVTYNSEKYIKKLLVSLDKFIPERSEVIVVDNNSSDNTLNILKSRKNIHLIENDSNDGFAKGSNKGAEEARGEYLLFLNPDTDILDNSISILLDFIKSHQEVGLVGPALIEPLGNTQPSVRNLPTILGAFAQYYLGVKNKYDNYVPEGQDPVEVQSVFGAAIMLKKATFAKIGGFNEKYFMYFEDLELCKSVRNLGLKAYYLPKAKFSHVVGGSISEAKLKWIANSTNIYHGTTQAFLIHFIIRLRNALKRRLHI